MEEGTAAAAAVERNEGALVAYGTWLPLLLSVCAEGA
jgi:hypothetical protein